MNSIQKKELRNHLKEKREQISDEIYSKKSLKIQNNIINSKEYKNAKTIFCYISFGKEIDTFLILKHSIKNKKRLSVPLIIEKEMIACEIDSLENLKVNKFGILEPATKKEIPKEKIDLIIVPALGFDKNGFRIGYGGGFYDKYLKDYKGMSIGITFSEFVIKNFIPDTFDVPVKKLFIS